ncbi:hypothetical protein AAHE18_11G090700 [Arachis hypogaea]|uniref:Uncharacterized protein n=1 Tax=Arachis hypogaea TaxID=3818 RepID=A0A445AR66_ARAHY|nr:hypothetical protein Ahy_B01g053087 [Arachis hypogaea]
MTKSERKKRNNKSKDEQRFTADTAKLRKFKEPSKSSTFLDKMKARLSGGHFRMINEKLCTCMYVLLFALSLSGKETLNYFQEEPSLFDL